MATIPNPDEELDRFLIGLVIGCDHKIVDLMSPQAREYTLQMPRMLTVKKLIKSCEERLVREAHIDELEMAIAIKGKVFVHGVILNAKDTESDPDSIDINMLKARLAALKEGE